jgi:hypothetical protein
LPAGTVVRAPLIGGNGSPVGVGGIKTGSLPPPPPQPPLVQRAIETIAVVKISAALKFITSSLSRLLKWRLIKATSGRFFVFIENFSLF